MSSIEPGKGGGIVAPVLGVTTAATLPVTGAHSAVEMSLAVAAALAVWALAYVAVSKLSR